MIQPVIKLDSGSKFEGSDQVFKLAQEANNEYSPFLYIDIADPIKLKQGTQLSIDDVIQSAQKASEKHLELQTYLKRVNASSQ